MYSDIYNFKEFIVLFNFYADDVKEFCDSRIKLLEKKHPHLSMYNDEETYSFNKGYIQETSMIHVKHIGNFRLDDKNLYEEFFEFLHQKEKLKADPKIFTYIMEFVYQKFGDKKNKESKIGFYIANNERFLNTDQETDVVSINEYYQRNIATSIEIGAIAQNLLMLIGFESYMVSGSIDTDKQQGKSHTFNIIKNKEEEYFLLDVSIPIKSNNKNYPLLMPIGNNIIQSIEIDYNQTIPKGDKENINIRYTIPIMEKENTKSKDYPTN